MDQDRRAMAREPEYGGAVEIFRERQTLERSLTLLPLFGIIYFTMSGGTFGMQTYDFPWGLREMTA